MPDTTNQIKVSGDEVMNTTVFPDSKLQTLDRRVGKDQLYFDRKLFEASVGDWSGIPIIYQPDGIHPTDFDAVMQDPVSAAEAIDGKCVGSVSNPRIVIPGGPRLMAELDIDESETEIVELWQQGKLFPSTAFMATSDGDRLTSPPIPNHVLLFPIKVDEVLPGDYGAFVNTLGVQPIMKKETKKTCNAEELPQAPEPQAPEPAPETAEPVAEEVTRKVEDVAEDVAEKQTELDELRSEIDLLKQEIAGLKQANEPAEEPAKMQTQIQESEQVTEQAQEPVQELVVNTEEITPEAAAEVVSGLDEEIRWRDEQIAALRAEIEGMKAGKAALEEKIKSMETSAAEAEFNSIVEKLPVGMKATPEQIEALHAQFVAGDMKSLLHTVLNSTAPAGATQRVGQPFTQSTTIADTNCRVGNLNKPRNKKE